MKIAYLHGLESDNISPKNDWLRTVATDVYDPLIDYQEKGIYKKIFNEVKAFKPDIIIGSSMGGYFAHKISKKLVIPALLFNPAIPYRSFQPDMAGVSDGMNNPKTHIIFGQQDDVIIPSDTVNSLKKFKYTSETGGHGHQTPTTVFIKAVKDFAKL